MSHDLFPSNAKMLPTYSRADIEQLATGDLLALYNQLTGKSTAKFQSRAKGLEQVWKALEEAGRCAQPVASPVGDLLALLAEGPHTVTEIRDHLGLPTDKKARNVIDRARREGHAVKNVAPRTFGFEFGR